MSRKTMRRRNPGQFRKGQSGNPKGRPRREQPATESSFDIVFDRRIAVRRDGTQRELTVEEALQHQTLKDALAGKCSAQRAVWKMIGKREAYLAARLARRSSKVVVLDPEQDPDNADAAMLLLGIAERNEERAEIESDREQLLFATWVVQAALRRRRGGSRLSDDEVKDIKRCTRDAERLRWPRGTDA